EGRSLIMSISKAIVSVLLIGPAVWVLLRQPRGAEKVPAGFTVVDYWEKWTGKEAEQMQEIVSDFNRTVGQEKKIFVRYLSMSSVDRKTLISTAAGVPPDVAGLWDAQAAQFSDLDALEPLDGLAAARGIGPDTYKKVYWDTCHYKGHLWALPSTPSAIALHYNKFIFWQNADKLRAAGLDPNRPPRTIGELDRYADVLNTFDPVVPTRLDRAGYMPNQTWYSD